ncbi:MAG: hypothetical protein IJ130_07705 [Solobacterium sp.]|nr:hypothetical protein [Solobacterium sp.]
MRNNPESASDQWRKENACIAAAQKTAAEIPEGQGIESETGGFSLYRNDIRGYLAKDVCKDEEGVQTVRNPALNISFMIKAIQANK